MNHRTQTHWIHFLIFLSFIFWSGCTQEKTVSANSFPEAKQKEKQTPKNNKANQDETDLTHKFGKPSFQILAITDLMGELEPCGCTSKPLGGIDKLVNEIVLQKKQAPTSVIVVGDTFQGAFKSHNNYYKIDFLEAVFKLLKPTAKRFTEKDDSFCYGQKNYKEILHAEANFPKEPISFGNVKVGFVSASDLKYKTDELNEALKNIKSQVQNLKKLNSDFIVGLIVGDQRISRRAIKKINGVEFWIQGGIQNAHPNPPLQVKSSFVLQGGRQGQGLLRIQFWDHSNGESAKWVDASAWTKNEKKEALQREIRALEKKITGWRKEKANENNVATQEKKLNELKQELKDFKASTIESKKILSARWIPITKDKPSHPNVKKQLEKFNKHVNDQNKQNLADVLPPAPEPGEASFIGSRTCRNCHTTQFNWWKETPHGHAYSTLEKQNKEFHLECVGCHVTGYGKPGGSNATHVENLKNVGCENCHGPGSIHIQNPVANKLPRQVPEQTCIMCHNEEHSDLFIYNEYMKKIRVPGHGLPVESK